jgi:hypothetical protein
VRASQILLIAACGSLAGCALSPYEADTACAGTAGSSVGGEDQSASLGRYAPNNCVASVDPFARAADAPAAHKKRDRQAFIV